MTADLMRDHLDAEAARLAAARPDAIRPVTEADMVVNRLGLHATIDDAIAVLRYIVEAPVSALAGDHPKHLQEAAALGTARGLAWTVEKVLGAMSAQVRSAPPADLAELVRDNAAACLAADGGCSARVLPWALEWPYCSHSRELVGEAMRP